MYMSNMTDFLTKNNIGFNILEILDILNIFEYVAIFSIQASIVNRCCSNKKMECHKQIILMSIMQNIFHNIVNMML